jgi:uncharacterized BrkB/YihY/UPF0761 family membrane protein
VRQLGLFRDAVQKFIDVIRQSQENENIAKFVTSLLANSTSFEGERQSLLAKYIVPPGMLFFFVFILVLLLLLVLLPLLYVLFSFSLSSPLTNWFQLTFRRIFSD